MPIESQNIVVFTCDSKDSSLDWQGCPGWRRTFSTGSKCFLHSFHWINRNGDWVGFFTSEKIPTIWAPLSASNIGQLLKDIRQTAYAEGKHDGCATGMEQGKQIGYMDGKRDGYADGYAAGMEQGKSDGHASGMEAGKHVGYMDGKRDGNAEGYAAGMEQGKSDGNAAGMEAGKHIGYIEGLATGKAEGHSWSIFPAINEHDPCTACVLQALDLFSQSMKQVNHQPYLPEFEAIKKVTEEDMERQGLKDELIIAQDDEEVPLTSLQSLRDQLDMHKELFGKEQGAILVEHLTDIVRTSHKATSAVTNAITSQINHCICKLLEGIKACGQGASSHLLNHAEEEQAFMNRVRTLSTQLSDAYSVDCGKLEECRAECMRNMINLYSEKFDAVLSQNAYLDELLLAKRLMHKELQEEAEDWAQLSHTWHCQLAEEYLHHKDALEAFQGTAQRAFEQAMEQEQYVPPDLVETLNSLVLRKPVALEAVTVTCLELVASQAQQFQKGKYSVSQHKWRSEYVSAFVTKGSKKCESAVQAAMTRADQHAREQVLLQQWADWMNSFFNIIDVKAEENLQVFRHDIPSDSAKLRAVLNAVEYDFLRRRKDMEQALTSTYQTAKGLEAKLKYLSRCGPSAKEDLSHTQMELDKLRLWIQFQDQELWQTRDSMDSLLQSRQELFAKSRYLTPVEQIFSLKHGWLDSFFFSRSSDLLPMPTSLAVTIEDAQSVLSESIPSSAGGIQTLAHASRAQPIDPSGTFASDLDSEWQMIQVKNNTSRTSEPGPVRQQHCMLHDSILQTPDGKGVPAQIAKGLLLQSHECTMTAKAVHLHPEYNHDVTTIIVQVPKGNKMATFMVTADHGIPAQRGEGPECLYEARELSPKHHLQVCDASGHFQLLPIHEVRTLVQSVKVVEVQVEPSCPLLLQARDMTMFLVVASNTPPEPYIVTVGNGITSLVCAAPKSARATCSEPSHAAPGIQLAYVVGGTADDGPTGSRVGSASDDLNQRFAPHARDIRVLHSDNCARPCKYFVNGRCRNGDECSRCHHPEHLEKRLVHRRRRKQGGGGTFQ